MESPGLHSIMATARYRQITSTKGRALYLFYSYDVTQANICRALSIRPGTLSKWISCPEAAEGRGNSGYLTKADYNHLFNEIVKERADQHNAMTAAEIVQEV